MDRAFWAAGTIIVVLYAMIPVAWIVSLSLKPADDLSDNKFFPRSISFDNYTSIFDDGQFTAALRNSIGIAAISTVLAVILAMFAAYAIVRLDFPGKAHHPARAPWPSPCSRPSPSPARCSTCGGR